MSSTDVLYQALLAGLTAGAIAALAIAILRGRVSLDARLAILIAAVSAIASCVLSSRVLLLAGEPFPGAERTAALAASAIEGLVWLLVLVVLDDRKVRSLLLAPTAILVILRALPDARARIVADALVIVLALHALWTTFRGWRGDLVEARRRLRRPMLVLAGIMNLYLLWIVFLAYAPDAGVIPPSVDLWNLTIEAACAIGAAGVLLEGRAALLAPEIARPTADTIDDVALDRLRAVMVTGEAWRREGLTIAALAAEVGVGEQKLRRLINGHLGHRHFAAFVNSYRIEAAKRRLSDPAERRRTVAEIAFDLGFSSLGPFNRAFKDAVGQTPTAWRKAALEPPDQSASGSVIA